MRQPKSRSTSGRWPASASPAGALQFRWPACLPRWRCCFEDYPAGAERKLTFLLHEGKLTRSHHDRGVAGERASSMRAPAHDRRERASKTGVWGRPLAAAAALGGAGMRPLRAGTDGQATRSERQRPVRDGRQHADGKRGNDRESRPGGQPTQCEGVTSPVSGFCLEASALAEPLPAGQPDPCSLTHSERPARLGRS